MKLKSIIMKRSIITELFSHETKLETRKNGRFFLEGKLVNKEFYLFDAYEIKKMGKNFRYMILRITDPGNIPFKQISRIVNTLFLMYGEDDHGRGKFSDLDLLSLQSEDKYWYGRSWLTDDKYVQPAMIRYDDSEGLRLFVMNI